MVSEGYRAVMVTEESYDRLIKTRTALSRLTGKKESISGSIMYLLQRSLISVGLDMDIEKYIIEIVEELKKIEEVDGIVLFGSIVKGNYNDLSDVDLLIIIEGDIYRFVKKLWGIRKKTMHYEEKFMEEGKYYRFSPLVLHDTDLKKFSPFYFDIVDYGIIMYEKNKVVTTFFNYINKFPHKRHITAAGVELTWRN